MISLKINKHNRKLFSILTKDFIENSKKEMIIQVDKDNKEIGPISKYESHTSETINKGILHRAFSLFIFDKNQNLLLQKRSKHKVTFPNLWSNSVCSHPLFNDIERTVTDFYGVRRAAQRRMKFELGFGHEEIDDFKCIDSYLYQALDGKNWGEYECNVKR